MPCKQAYIAAWGDSNGRHSAQASGERNRELSPLPAPGRIPRAHRPREASVPTSTCEYWARPVPGFGDPQARVLVFGLAPGAHGSNRTGRPFTGDASGKFMYPVLHRLGFASQPDALHREDGMELRDLWITAAVRCAPPDNKPLPSEIANCAEYTARELAALKSLKVVVALGKIAFDAYLDALRRQSDHRPKNRLPLRPRRRIPDAQRHHPACLLSPLQPEHRHRKTHHRHVRSRLPPRPKDCFLAGVRSQYSPHRKWNKASFAEAGHLNNCSKEKGKRTCELYVGS